MFFVSQCFSQKGIVDLKGRVSSDSLSVSGITILNKTTEKWTTTSEEGLFEIPVALTDTLMISAVHINDVNLVVNKENVDGGELRIQLEEFINQMDVVILNNLIGASGTDFSAAFKPTTNPDPEKMRLDEIQRLAETDPLKRSSGVNILGGLALLGKLFKSKDKPRELSRAEKLQRWEAFKIDFLNEFGTSFFTEQLGISDQVIDEFFVFCKIKKEDLSMMYNNNDKLSLLEFFVKQSKVYKSMNKL